MNKDLRQQDEENTQIRARMLGVRYYDVRTLDELPLFTDDFTNEEMYRNHTVVLVKDAHRITFAITTQTPQPLLTQLKKQYQDYQVGYVMISETAFNEFMVKYDPPKKVVYEDVEIRPEDADKSIEDVSTTIERVVADDVFNYLVRQAFKLGASDMHLETQEDHVRARFRVDGVLHQIADMTYEKYRQLSSTIAVNANVSTSSPSPQTGHMNYKIKDDEGQTVAEVNMRLETIPTLFGQDVVMRLFQMEEAMLKLDRLGLSKRESDLIEEVVSHPSGLVLSVGPTGSGKTTTLYSILSKLNTPTRKIITLEDPVEYDMKGVVQIPVDRSKNGSFADALGSVLRLDPDVIMIGEIRDADTARTALQASLSGHLVLSTFHASDTTTALSRITEFLGDNPLFSSAIRLIIAQRLVRVLDDASKQQTQLEPHVMERLRTYIDGFPEGIEKPNLDEMIFYRPGVSIDAPFGYSGQTAAVEMLKMSPRLEKMLHRLSDDTRADDLRRVAREDGMMTLMQDGILKVAKGLTTVDEIFRVIA